MAKDPAFLFYPGDYLRDTQCLSSNAQVAYDRIMCEHMRNICISKSQLKFFTKRLKDEERDEIMHLLTEVQGGYQIEWVAESVNKRRAYSDSRRKNKASKSINHMTHISSSYDDHMENENENEIEDVNKGIGGVGEKGLVKRETAITKSEPRTPDTIRAYFAEIGAPHEADHFIDYYTSNGWKVGRNAMKDWKATARNWMRRADPKPTDDRRIVRDTKVSDMQRNAAIFENLVKNQNPNTNEND